LFARQPLEFPLAFLLVGDLAGFLDLFLQPFLLFGQLGHFLLGFAQFFDQAIQLGLAAVLEGLDDFLQPFPAYLLLVGGLAELIVLDALSRLAHLAVDIFIASGLGGVAQGLGLFLQHVSRFFQVAGLFLQCLSLLGRLGCEPAGLVFFILGFLLLG